MHLFKTFATLSARMDTKTGRVRGDQSDPGGEGTASEHEQSHHGPAFAASAFQKEEAGTFDHETGHIAQAADPRTDWRLTWWPIVVRRQQALT